MHLQLTERCWCSLGRAPSPSTSLPRRPQKRPAQPAGPSDARRHGACSSYAAHLDVVDVLPRHVGYVQQTTDTGVVDAHKHPKRLNAAHDAVNQGADLHMRARRTADGRRHGTATVDAGHAPRARDHTSSCRKSSFSLAFTTEHTTFRLARATSRMARLVSRPA